jgi:aerobic-type carbon monoxide dehydrogenase small subunit (CoxS/CutS family)
MYGKGDKQRPLAVSKEVFESNWDTIFNKKSYIEEDECECQYCTGTCIKTSQELIDRASVGSPTKKDVESLVKGVFK